MTAPLPSVCALSGLWRAASPGVAAPWLLVLLHGVGSNAHDLIGLAPLVPGTFHVLSVQAPISLGKQAYAWFEFAVHADGSRSSDVAQELRSRASLQRTIEQAALQSGVPPERVVVAGFSQGGIMALNLLLTVPECLGAVCIWHSRLMPEIVSMQVPAARLRGRKVWLSHGLEDAVIPLRSAHAIEAHLLGLAVDVQYREYPGGHQLHPQELQHSVQWLTGLAAG